MKKKEFQNTPDDFPAEAIKNTSISHYIKSQIIRWLSIVLPVLLGVYLIFYTYTKFTPEQILEIEGYFQRYAREAFPITAMQVAMKI